MNTSVLFSAANYAGNWYALPYLLAGLLSLSIAVAISVREKRSWNTVSFFLLILTAASWLFCYLGITLSANGATAQIWSKLHATFVVAIPPMVLVFALSAVGKLRRKFLWVVLSAALSSAFLFSIWMTFLFVAEPAHYFWGYFPRYKLFSLFFLGYFFIVLLTSLFLFHRKTQKTSSPLMRKRMRIFLSAFLIAYCASVDYLPMYGFSIYPFGYFPFFIGLSLLAYGIMRYRLTDITPSYAAEQIIKTMADGLLVIDRENVVKVANRKAEELFSRNGASLEGTLIGATGIPFFQESNVKRFLEVASVESYEISFRSASGAETFVEIATSVLQNKTGDNVAVVCILKDVTARKASEKITRESEMHYRLLAENVTDLVWTMNRDFQFIYMSPSVENLRGFTPEEALKQSLDETFTVASHAAAFKLFSELLAAKTIGQAFETKVVELEYRCKNGLPLPVELKVSFVPGKNGFPDQILGISKDIRELEIARKNLEVSEKHYRDLVFNLLEPVLTLDHQGCVVFLNRSAERLLGFSNEEVKGRHIAKANLISEECLQETVAEISNLILGRNPASFTIKMLCRNGAPLPLTAATRIIRKNRNQFHIEFWLSPLADEKAA